MKPSSSVERHEGADVVASSRRRTGTLALSIATVLSLVLGLFIAPLAAQDGSTNRVDFEVLQVDVRESTGTVVVRPAGGSDGGDLTVEIEGEEITTTSTPIGRSTVAASTILVIDDSETANDVAGFDTIRSAALAYVDGLSSNTSVMVVRAGGGRLTVQPEVTFTRNHDAVRAGINALTPGGGAVTLNAIAGATDFFTGDAVRNVVAFVGSPGANSTASVAEARGSLIGANAGLTVIAPEAGNLDISAFASIADQVRGGTVFRGTGDADMSAVAGTAAQTHEGIVVGTFPTDSIINVRSDNGQGEDGTNELIARYGDGAERVRLVPDGILNGASLNAPALVESSRFSILSGNIVALIAIAIMVIAVLVFAFTLMSILFGADNTLNSTLSVYGSQQDKRTDDQKDADDAFASQRSRIIEQVVDRAEEAAEARGSLNSTANLLEKAEIPLRVGEAFAIQVGVVIVAFGLGFIITGASLIGGLVFMIPAAIVPTMFVRFKVKKRAKALEAQLPDTLNLLASTLKAGYSFLQGMDAVGNEAEEPLAGEFRRTVNEARLGKDMDDALDDLADRVDSQDMLWAIVAIKIQREVGGNLAELLATVSDTMTSRARLRGEVRALTAEGRISAYVLLGLPFGVALAMYFLNREYIAELWSGPIGIGAVITAMISMTIGGFWMNKIIDIEL